MPMGDNVQALVSRLNALHEGWKVQCELIAHGQEAVAPLVDFLLSPPSMFPQPRCLAAEALGMIGGEQALQGLCRVLSIHDVTAADPVIRLAEETVRDCAAEQLERLGDPRAIPPLLQALRRQPLPRAAHALASFDVDAAIPRIIDYLEDDFVRDRMAAALLAFGPQAIEPLIKTLRRRTCLGDEETPASIGRRAAAARVLGELGEARAAKALRPLLDDPAPEVRVEAAVALTQLAEGEVFAEAVSTLIAALDAEPARLSWRAEEGLSDAGTAAVCLIAQALEAALVEENNAGREPLSPATLVRMIRLLGRWPSPGVVGVLRSVAIDSDLTLRAEAIRALGRLRDPEGIPLLVYVLEKDENPGMRAVAAEALGMFTREAVVGPLVGALQDRHPTVRQAAAHALTKLGPLARPHLRQAITQHRWALSRDRQRLVWEARRMLRRLRADGQT
jgi:HEAT repeat protein